MALLAPPASDPAYPRAPGGQSVSPPPPAAVPIHPLSPTREGSGQGTGLEDGRDGLPQDTSSPSQPPELLEDDDESGSDSEWGSDNDGWTLPTAGAVVAARARLDSREPSREADGVAELACVEGVGGSPLSTPLDAVDLSPAAIEDYLDRIVERMRLPHPSAANSATLPVHDAADGAPLRPLTTADYLALEHAGPRCSDDQHMLHKAVFDAAREAFMEHCHGPSVGLTSPRFPAVLTRGRGGRPTRPPRQNPATNPDDTVRVVREAVLGWVSESLGVDGLPWPAGMLRPDGRPGNDAVSIASAIDASLAASQTTWMATADTEVRVRMGLADAILGDLLADTARAVLVAEGLASVLVAE